MWVVGGTEEAKESCSKRRGGDQWSTRRRSPKAGVENSRKTGEATSSKLRSQDGGLLQCLDARWLRVGVLIRP